MKYIHTCSDSISYRICSFCTNHLKDGIGVNAYLQIYLKYKRFNINIYIYIYIQFTMYIISSADFLPCR